MRTHRIGSITFGGVLIIFGLLFLGELLFAGISYEFIFRLWPVVLIGLGLEILTANIRYRAEKTEFVYDWAAIFLMIILMFFAMGMAGIDMTYRYYQGSLHI